MYRDDPTIIAWNLINEPRCESWLAANKDCNKRFQAWVSEMSTHVRSLDPNHMITIGSEGFFGDSTPQLMQYNPQAWARELGQDFVLNTNLPNIDFATVHAWPDNWMLPQVGWDRAARGQHLYAGVVFCAQRVQPAGLGRMLSCCRTDRSAGELVLTWVTLALARLAGLFALKCLLTDTCSAP